MKRVDIHTTPRRAATTWAGIVGSTVLLGACAGLSPKTFTDAARIHQNFPTLADQIATCVADDPEAYAALKPHFNALVDKWQLANNKGPEEIAREMIGVRAHLYDIGREWGGGKAILQDRGIDCGAEVKRMATLAESGYNAFLEGVENNIMIATWLEYGQMLSGFVVRRDGSVTKL